MITVKSQFVPPLAKGIKRGNNILEFCNYLFAPSPHPSAIDFIKPHKIITY